MIHLREAGFKITLEFVAIEVFADEDELGGAGLVILPRAVGHAFEERVHALEDVAFVASLDGEHALHAVQVFPSIVQQESEPIVDEIEVEIAVEGERDAPDGVVVVIGDDSGGTSSDDDRRTQ